ncbi:hypothetical protein LguiB_008620 [Lonicera macranthoides]
MSCVCEYPIVSFQPYVIDGSSQRQVLNPGFKTVTGILFHGNLYFLIPSAPSSSASIFISDKLPLTFRKITLEEQVV